MEIIVKTSGSARRKVAAAAERFNGKIAFSKRGEVVVSVNEEDAIAFKRTLDGINEVVGYSDY